MSKTHAIVAGLCIAAFVGCGQSEEATQTPTATQAPAGPVDLRFDIPAPPEGGLQFKTSEMTIPAFSEKQWCFFFDYNGPDVGVTRATSYQDGAHGHHAQLMISNADPELYPAGAVFDCTDRETLPMTDMEPLYIGTDLVAEGVAEMLLPEGMAVSLKGGTRLVLQSHYLNTTGSDILVQDATNLGVVPAADVQIWAAPWAHVSTSFEIPPSSDKALDISCQWYDEVYIFNLLGHMHEWGTRFSVDYIDGEGATERIYDLPQWDAQWRDTPPVITYGLGAFKVNPGERFVTHCEWFNDTDHTLAFPEEMCVSVGMVYPSKVPMLCEPE